MKRYFHVIAAVIVFIPLLTGAKMSSSPAPFEMGDICPKPFSDKKWRFTNPTASMDAGTCVAYISGSGPIPANDWQRYLRPEDRNDGYTDGAGGAACQRAACALHVGIGAVAAKNAFPASLTPEQIKIRSRALDILGRSVAPSVSAPVAAYSAVAPIVRLAAPSAVAPVPVRGYPVNPPAYTAPAVRAVVTAPPASYYADWMKPKPTPKCDAISLEECRRDAFEVQGNSMGTPKNTCQWAADPNNSNGGVCRMVQLLAQ